MTAELQINLLGSPGVVLNGAPLTGFVSGKAQALVYYLAATGKLHTRETLAGLLWSEVPDATAKKNLRDVLSNLRHLMAPYLFITRQLVTFVTTADYTVDSLVFTTKALSARPAGPSTLTAEDARPLRDAMTLYKGEFLAGFYVTDAPLFEEWALGERERLRQLALQALNVLAGAFTQQGDFALAVEYITRLLAMDAWREEAHRQLMMLLALSGQRSAALAQYEKCVLLLEEELGVEPAEETTALYEQIKTGDFPGQAADRSLQIVTREFASLPVRLPAPPHNLPAQLTPFIGREAELSQVLACLRDPTCRVLTLVGQGGIGKTRLATQAGHALLTTAGLDGLFAHGVYFASLAAVEAPPSGGWPMLLNPLITGLAEALGFSFSGQATLREQLFNYLAQKEMLLILDNFEHLLATAHFLVELLQAAPGLKLLVTSRGRLNVRGEQLLTLDGLPFPPSHDVTDWEHYDAIQLFLQRAQAAHPHFVLQAIDRPAITQICRLVNGLPLGIELSASWIRLISCQEIAREIEQSLSFLESSMRDVPPRHQSLRAVFDHSWRLLTQAERQALRQLSLFRGGFSREAAAQVASASLSTLAALVDNSLVRRTTPSGDNPAAARYELLEIVRQYAAEKLAQAPSAAGGIEEMEVRDRHCRYYLAFLEQQKADLQGGRQLEALAEVGLEIENIRTAWRWAVAQMPYAPAYVTAVGEAVESLFHFYDMRSRFQEGEELLAQAASCLAEMPSSENILARNLVRGKVLARQGWFTFHLSRQVEAKTLLEKSLEILRLLEATAEMVFPLNYLASVTTYLGDYEAAQHLCHQALAASRASGDRLGVAIAKNILSQIAHWLGHHSQARQHGQESLAIEREIGNRWSMTYSLITLGRVAYALGDYSEAQARFQESLAIREAMRDARGSAICLNYLGDTAYALADYGEANRLYQAGLELFRQIYNQAGLAASLTRLGHVALAQGKRKAAATCFHEALHTAHKSQAVPRILDALAGMALLLAEEEPERALTLSTLVWRHPGTKKESKDRAAGLLLKLAGQLPSVDSAPQEKTLTEIVEEVLYQER